MQNLTGKTISYHGFEPEVHGNFKFGIERMANMLDELSANIEAHWGETEVLYRQERSNVNYPAYIRLENEGKFVTFTVRSVVTGEMVGHIAFYVYESMHNIGIMEAREDAFFIVKSYRGGRLALRLYDYAEKCFRKMGVHQMTMSSKEPAGGPSIDKFLRKKGYGPVAIGYFKRLTEDSSDGNV